jgi:hypothetical protein
VMPGLLCHFRPTIAGGSLLERRRRRCRAKQKTRRTRRTRKVRRRRSRVATGGFCTQYKYSHGLAFMIFYHFFMAHIIVRSLEESGNGRVKVQAP